MIREALRRYWFDFRVPAAKVNLVRVAFFSVLAVDSFLMLAHAPRYGAGGFNVSHFPGLDPWLPLPDRRVMVVFYLCEAYLAARIVFGAAIDLSVRILAVLFACTYFSSQADAYQHHYLVFLLLVIACFVPWDRARDLAQQAGRGDGDLEEPSITSWALRLVAVQLALVYFWAAVAKVDPVWLDGTALHAQITGETARSLVEVLSAAIPGHPSGYAVLAWSVLLGELFLAATLPWRRLWAIAWIVGMAFHLGVELIGFDIGLFSWFMAGIYLLFLPDRFVTRVSRRWRSLTSEPSRALTAAWVRGKAPASWVLFAMALGVGLAAVSFLPFEWTGVAAIAVGALGLVAVLHDGLRPSIRLSSGHLLACLTLGTLHLATDQAFDYYRYLGGTSRRLGDSETMERAYRKLTEIRPDYGPAYFHLGTLAEASADRDRALELYRQAQEREPRDPRPFEGEARLRLQSGDERGALEILESCETRVPAQADCLLDSAAIHARGGRREEARSAARRALEVDPGNRTALSLLRWAGGS